MNPHEWNVQTDFCDRCGAARAEVEDGLRLNCQPSRRSLPGGAWEDGAIVTYLTPGGRALAKLFWSTQK